ncbi:GMC oxidoreductase-domain-containing protein [Lentinula aff. detonsa]|nr:GMC oxidoreductase-domain-containing protein [Lentinula aff. detonsa]
MWSILQSSVDAGVKLRPTAEELEELGPAFEPIWDEFYIGAPDKPVAILGATAGDFHNSAPTGYITFGMNFVTAYPKAIGSTYITSAVNPWAPLRFDPQFLEECVVYSHYRPVAIDAPKIQYSKEDDRAIEDYIKATVGTTWHSLGTCAMKPRAAGGVVDPRLNVYGVENLKVADISIAPLNVGANTNSTALVIGEKAFLLIADDLGISLKCTQATGEFKGPDV